MGNKIIAESMRAKRVYEFLKTGDVKSSLGVGRVAEIRDLFRSVGIPDESYVITDTEVKFGMSLDLSRLPVTELPEGLIVWGSLYLGGTGITELPEKLNIRGTLDLRATLVTKLPEGLIVGDDIYINKDQTQLKTYIESSKFKNKLIIW